MRKLAIALGLVAALSIAANVMAVVALKRTGPTGDGEYSRLTLPERVDRLEIERMHFSVYLKHLEESAATHKRLRESVDELRRDVQTHGEQLLRLMEKR